MINSTYKKANRLFYTLVLICLVQLGWAQIYPVQVNSNVIPPYLSSVTKYSTTTDQKYLVNIFTSDLNVVNRQVRLKLYIQGNGIQAQSTPVVVGAAPLFINGGESLQLNNLDLAPYFELQNLQGINPLQYSGVLPQGNYSFCIEVYDFITNQPISQKSCTFFYFIYNDPPFLNLPFNHEVIHFQDPQNIIFTWTPRHINATNIEYEFVLIELLDNQAPSNYAFMVGAPIWQTITNNTILHYDFTLPQLTLGKKYAWRVKAVSQPGFGEDAVFNNNGYSEIFDFVYAGNCNAPEFVIAQSVSARQAKIMWQNNPNHLSYIVQYRKLGTEIWFNAPVANNEAQLFDLEPSTTYEFQVGGTCLGDVTTFSAINQFTQPETNVAVIDCGIAPTIDLANVTLYSEALAEDMVFMAADFAVHINEIEGVGTYTGKGWTRLPYLSNIKIAVEFENIKLNSELQLVDGEVRAQYDPEWSNILDVNEVIDVVENVLDNFQESNDTHNHTVNYVIGDVSNIVVEDGKILVTNPDTGLVSNIFDFDQGETTTITDSEGSVYTVDPNGNVSFQGQGVGIANASNTENLNSKGEVIALSNVGAKVVFSRNDQSVAFDDSSANYSGAPNKLAAEYKTIKDGSGNDYPFYYKGIINKEDGKVSYDYVTAQITITDTLIKAKNIVFNVKGIKVNAIDSTTVGNVVTKTLKVPAFTTEGENELLALVKTDSLKQKVVGAMMVVPIKDIGTVNVNLVPVNGATITQADIQEIKNIYGGAGVTLNITTLPAHTDGITTLECGTSGWIANYTNEQNAFIDRFKATTTINNNAYYLFVTKNITPSRPLSGFMPLHRQFGFVFTGQTGTGEIKQTNGSGLATVIAHELGHGAFELEHPWEKYDYNSESYATDWLMDYASGTKLPYRHWQQISHPKTKLYLFQSDESGESTRINRIPDFFQNTDKSFSFMTVIGSYITLPHEVYDIVFVTGIDILKNYVDLPTGALYSFKIGDEKFIADVEHSNKFQDNLNKSDLTFIYKGFKSTTTNQYYQGLDYNNPKDKKFISFVPLYTTSTNTITQDYNVEIGMHLMKTTLETLSFSPEPGQSVSFNIIDDYNKVQPFYNYNAQISEKFPLENKAYKAQFENNDANLGSVLKYTNADNYTLLSKFAVLYNAQPNVFNSYPNTSNFDVFFQNKTVLDFKTEYVSLVQHFLNTTQNSIADFINIVNEFNQPNGVYNISDVKFASLAIASKNILTEDFEKTIFSKEIRTKAIQILAIGSKYGNVSCEEEIIRLIKFIPQGDESAIYDFLKINNFSNFINIVDPFDAQNQEVFFDLTTKLINKYGKPEDRINILKSVQANLPDDWGNDSERIIAGATKNLEGRDSDILEFVILLKNDPLLVKFVFETLDNITSVDPLNQFIFNICNWFISSGLQNLDYSVYDVYANTNYLQQDLNTLQPISSQHAYIPYYRITLADNANEFLSNVVGYSPFIDDLDFTTSFTSSGKILVEFNVKKGSSPRKTIINREFNPMELVYLHFRETININNIEFKEGQAYMVPALFLHWIDDTIHDNQWLSTARIAGDILAIAAAPATFGASATLLYADVAIMTIDIAVQLTREDLVAQYGTEYADYWDSMYTMYSLVYLPQGIKGLYSIVQNGPKTLLKLSAASNVALRNIATQVKALSNVERATLIQKIQNVYNNVYRYRALVSDQTTFANQLEGLQNLMVALAADSEYAFKAFSSTIKNNAISYVVATNVEYNILKYSINSDKILTIYNLRRIPQELIDANTTFVTVEKFKAINLDLDPNSIKTFEIVEDASNAGQLYVRYFLETNFKNISKYPLNSDYLGVMAINYRKTNSLWHDGNVVVFEYLDNFGQTKHLVQSTLINSGKHSERLALEALEAQGIPFNNIKKIYSELELCELSSGGYGSGGCKKMIIDKIGSNVEIRYSYDYPGHDITTKPLREASINQRRIDFENFK